MKTLYAKIKGFLTLGFIPAILSPIQAMALEKPTDGDFAYTIYHVAVDQILQGPIGFVTALGFVIFGAVMFTKSWVVAILSILGGTVILEADTIVASLGMLTSMV